MDIVIILPILQIQVAQRTIDSFRCIIRIFIIRIFIAIAVIGNAQDSAASIAIRTIIIMHTYRRTIDTNMTAQLVV